GGRQEEGYDVRLVILGYPGQPRKVQSTNSDWSGFTLPTHSALAFRDGAVFQWNAWFTRDGVAFCEGTVAPVATESEGVDWDGRSVRWGNFVRGGFLLDDSWDDRVVDAYNAARSARFEHG